MKKLTALLLVLVMSLSLVACGGGSEAPAKETGPDVQVLIDAFNSAADAFDLTANTINEDIDAYPQDLIDVMNDLADSMIEVKELLEGDQELTQEQIDAFVVQMNEVQTWSEDVYANLDDMTIEATTVDTSREAVIESFNYVSERFDAVSTEINANIEAYDEEFIDGMISIAEGMIAYKEVLDSGVELTEEEGMAILEDLLLIDEWIESLEG